MCIAVIHAHAHAIKLSLSLCLDFVSPFLFCLDLPCLVLLCWRAAPISIHQIVHGFTPPPVQNQYAKQGMRGRRGRDPPAVGCCGWAAPAIAKGAAGRRSGSWAPLCAVIFLVFLAGYIESVYEMVNLIKRANGNSSSKIPRSQTGRHIARPAR